ncbi:uncharacterized protein [Chelonus insularis]|uniref:uncharacterized protein n=1 Tax=Chelonus insularis TaxID=460826 RepID=UPI0015893632|nr:uncharacterized protein LOC118066271 [Chelonus insularis]
MKYVCGLLFATLVALTCGFPNGEPEEKPSNQLADLITQAQTSIQNLGKELQEKLNLPDQETVVNTIKTQSSTLVENVQNYIKEVSENVKSKNPELEKAWENVKEKLTQVVDDINKQIPNAKEQATKLQEVVTHGLNVIVEESGKAAKAIDSNSEKVREDIAKFTKEAVEIAVQTTKNLDAQLRNMTAASA